MQIIDILKDCPDNFPVTIYDDGGKYTTEYFTGTAKKVLEKYKTWYANDYSKTESGIDIYIIKSK
jgi:NMD protein affecting ribosome stability and mRNA decay